MPEAAEVEEDEKARKKREKKNDPNRKRWKRALICAAVIHLIILIGFAFLVVVPAQKDAPQIVAEVVAPDRTQDLEMQRLSAVKQLKETRASASSSISKLMRANTQTVIATPEIKTESTEPLGLGLGDLGNGYGFGSGAGGGSAGMARIPASMRGRCIPGERTRLLVENGGTPEVETSILLALDWLQRQQLRSGAWGAQYQGAMTGFALLAYLGHCETPDSPRYGETVTKGLLFLIELAERQHGHMASAMGQQLPYEHGIATYALGEAYSMLKDGPNMPPGLEETFARGVEIILKGQQQEGGWVYGYGRSGSGDLSVTGWQFQALKAAKETRMEFDGLDSAIQKTVRFISGRQGDKGGFGYRARQDKHSLTGVGILGLQFLSSGNRSQVSKGFSFYFSEREFLYETGSCNLYSWYYMTQAAFNHGGPTWQKWNDIYRDQIIRAQNSDGSWPLEGSGLTGQRGGSDSDVYRACLCALMLEVYYRYLPVTG